MLLLMIMTAVLQSTAPVAPAGEAAKPAVPGDPASTAKEEAAKAFVCRNEEVTGTRFTHKVCRRKDEFAQKAADEQQRLRQMQRPQYDCRNLNNGVC